MKKLVILGHGTGGTIIAAKMRQKLAEKDWQITVIDRDWQHHYQPGWLFIPFGIYTAADCVKPKMKFVPPGVNLVLDEITEVDPAKKQVKTKRDTYAYDWLVVATGCRIMPDEVEGMAEGMGGDIHTFYSQEGAVALYEKLKYFHQGRVVINIAELPFKCPVAPLEFAFMADWFFTKNGVRNNIEIELVTPLSAAFTKPVAAGILGQICQEKNIKVTPNYQIAKVDDGQQSHQILWGPGGPLRSVGSHPAEFWVPDHYRQRHGRSHGVCGYGPQYPEGQRLRLHLRGGRRHQRAHLQGRGRGAL